MPAAYHISEDEELITVRAEGEVDLIDLFETAKNLYADPAYCASTPLLVDLRNMRVKLEAAAVKPFNRFILAQFGRNRDASTAVVVDSEMSRELCAAIYWLNCAIGGSEMFEDYELALKWLIKREFANVL
jgi:hypothetical protein